MTAQSAQRLLRRVAALTAAAGLTATGCVTVHGEDAVLPAVSRAEAAKALKDFTAKSNKANRDVDLKLNGQIETGVLGEIDKATLTVKRSTKPQGDPSYKPLELSDSRFLIPEQRGWPKWFVADTANNRGKDRWLMAFIRYGADEPWKAEYLSVLTDDEMPDFAKDKDGHARAVPLNDTGLAIAPGDLAGDYTKYLKDGKPAEFEKGRHTTKLRKDRNKEKKTPKYVTQYADQAVPERTYPTISLRTADGGALVLFTSKHTWKLTAAQGVALPSLGPYTNTLMQGTPKRSVTRTALAENAAVIPKGTDGKVNIVNRIVGIISASGE